MLANVRTEASRMKRNKEKNKGHEGASCSMTIKLVSAVSIPEHSVK